MYEINQLNFLHKSNDNSKIIQVMIKIGTSQTIRYDKAENLAQTVHIISVD